MTPEGLTRDWRVLDRAVRLYEVVDRQRKGRPHAIISYAQLGARLPDRHGRPASHETIRRLVRNLEVNGWMAVAKEPGAGGTVGRFSLNQAVPDHPIPEFRSPDLRVVPARVTPTSVDRGPQNRGPVRAVPGLRESSKGEVPAAPPTLQPEPEPRPPTYVGRCEQHAHHPDPPNCIGCKQARIAHQKTLTDLAAAAPADVLCPTHLVQHDPRAECRSCRSDRLVSGHSAELNPAAAVGGAFADNITRSSDRFTAGFATSSSPARSTPARSARSMSSGSATGPLTSRPT